MTIPIRLAMFSIVFGLPLLARAQETITIHEWGTFTSLQDERGETVGGINVDDESLPSFVHRLAPVLLKRGEFPPSIFGFPCYAKGVPAAHPDITMRLETPVVYFHLPKSNSNPVTLDLTVSFRGGWLTEFYPAAKAVAPGLITPVFRQNQFYPAFQEEGGKPVRHGQNMGQLESSMVGKLSWQGLTIGGEQSGPDTKAHVWTAPRAVDAASVTIKGQSEKFLFYRGVGHVDAPLRIERDEALDSLIVRSQLDESLKDSGSMKVGRLWLTKIRTDGSSAFRLFGPLPLTTDASATLAAVPASFADAEFSRENLERLRDSMHETLVHEGLFADEADALLNTWELSYFKSAGLRLFFIVPPAWTDHQLPLQVSIPARLARVMVGRIELITPRQTALLAKIASSTHPTVVQDFHENIRATARNEVYSRVSQGEAPLSALGIPVPENYQAYLDLGRFRNALVLHKLRCHNNNKLRTFIHENGLQGFTSIEDKQRDISLSQRP